MQSEHYLFDKITQIFIIDSSHITDPSMSIALPFFAERKGKGAVDIGEDHFLIWGMVCLLYVHEREDKQLI